MEKLNDRKKQRLDRLYNKYKPHENFIIAKSARKTVRYIERNTINFSLQYKELRDKIINSSCTLLEYIYRVNMFLNLKFLFYKNHLNSLLNNL